MELKNDKLLIFAVGRSRKDISWRNTEVLWSDFVSRLSETHYTAETHAEYLAANKTRQDEIKDIGGFVGGFVTGGRRKMENILYRSMLTLDIDFANESLWDTFSLIYACAAVLYSTHKHTPESPRYRLVIPLSREVSRDEYTAIGRRIAGDMGIDMFDDTTFDPSRLMYWPSTSKGSEYVFQVQDGMFLDADEVLHTYRDWTNASEWPTSEHTQEIVRREIKKQGDPLSKQGIVGAFCRAYTMQEAIASFLEDVYAPCDMADRYTYIAGSTAGGLVLYEDKYAYSHHGTDPASGKLCNAFDLVRLHRFGLKDESAKENTPTNKLPSFAAMIDLCSADAAVKRTINRERVKAAEEDFGEGIGEEDPGVVDEAWADGLDIDKKGSMRGTIGNYLLILRGDPRLKGALAYNEFANEAEVRKKLPWRVKEDRSGWRDADDASLRSYIEKTYITVNKANLLDATCIVFEENRYDPVRDYLSGLVWDGVPRVDTLWIDYMGAEDTLYTRAVARKALAAAVARIMRPGTKFDYVTVLVGEQGIGKSSILKRLGRSWFSDNFQAVSGKEGVEQIAGVWIMEIAELAGLRKADREAIKSYVSTTADKARLAYAHRSEIFPRRVVFFASTNNVAFLNDPTGNRRFWPIEARADRATKSVFADLTEDEVGQIWAEAVQIYCSGEPLYLDKETEDLARQVQGDHAERDERVGVIQKFLEIPLPPDWDEMAMYAKRDYLNDPLSIRMGQPRARVCIPEIWEECFGRRTEDLDRRNSMDIHEIMRGMEGWRAAKTPLKFRNYGSQRYYSRQ